MIINEILLECPAAGKDGTTLRYPNQQLAHLAEGRRFDILWAMNLDLDSVFRCDFRSLGPSVD